jgi:hypothetical protein
MKSLIRKFALAAFGVLWLPAAALADGVVMGPCAPPANLVGNQILMFNCGLPGGGTAQYGARALSGVNFFHNIHSPVTVTGVAGQVTSFTMTIQSLPVWTVNGPVTTFALLVGTATILQPGATVEIVLTGTLGGPPAVVRQRLDRNAQVMFSVTMFQDQAIANIATSRLEITINGNATVTLPNSAEFQGEIPEPATLFLLGTGLTVVAMKLRKRRRNNKNVT